VKGIGERIDGVHTRDMNTKPAFTAADVAALAELIRPNLSADWNLEAAVALTEQQERDAFERRMVHMGEIVGALSGTFDEFWAEAAA
jgi:hypothetical protein